jgi:hypothetical protein
MERKREMLRVGKKKNKQKREAGWERTPKMISRKEIAKRPSDKRKLPLFS